MAVKYYGRALTVFNSARTLISFILCDLDSDKPVTGLIAGDLVYCIDTYKLYKATDATTLVEVGGGGASGALDDLTDVDTAGVSDGQVLTYDNGTSTWIPTTVAGTGTVDGSGATDQVAVWLDADTLLGDTGLTYNPATNAFLVSNGTITSKYTGEQGIVLDPNHAGHLSGNFNVTLLAPATMTADAILTLPAKNMTLTSGVSSFAITGGGTPKTLTVNDTGVAALLNVVNTFTKTNTFQRDAASTAAFAVKDVGGQNILDVDTVNQRVVIGNGRSFPLYTLDVTYDTTTYWLPNIIQVARFGRNADDYPQAGFGSSLLFTLGTYTTDDRSACVISFSWADPADATRKARSIWSVSDAAGDREALRIETDGSQAMIGFLGANASARSTGWAVSNVTTDKVYDANSTSQDEISDVLGTLILELITKGLIGS